MKRSGTGAVLQRADPALALRAALVDVADDLRRDAEPVVVHVERPDRVQLARARLRARPEDRGEAGGEARLGREPRHQPARAASAAASATGARDAISGKRPPLRRHTDRSRDPSRALALPREQLLRDAVAVVVRQHVHRRDAEVRQQRFVQIGLVAQRVRVVGRLGREAEAEHVGRDDAEARGERRPQLVPVPRRARKAVDAEQRPGRCPRRDRRSRGRGT